MALAALNRCDFPVICCSGTWPFWLRQTLCVQSWQAQINAESVLQSTNCFWVPVMGEKVLHIGDAKLQNVVADLKELTEQWERKRGETRQRDCHVVDALIKERHSRISWGSKKEVGLTLLKTCNEGLPQKEEEAAWAWGPSIAASGWRASLRVWKDASG